MVDTRFCRSVLVRVGCSLIFSPKADTRKKESTLCYNGDKFITGCSLLVGLSTKFQITTVLVEAVGRTLGAVLDKASEWSGLGGSLCTTETNGVIDALTRIVDIACGCNTSVGTTV